VDLIDVVRACFRRWYVVVPLLLITGYFAHHFYASVKPVYYSNAVIAIAPPNLQMQYRGDGVPVPRNGLLDVGGPTFVTNLAVLGFDEPAVRERVVADGGMANFTVRMFPSPVTGNGAGEQLPLIMIEATENDPASSQKTVQLAAAQSDSVLRNLQQQAQVPDDQMATALMASSPSYPAVGVPSRTKSTLYIALLGIAITVIIAVIADSILIRRPSRRKIEPVKRHNAGAAGEVSAGATQRDENVAADMAVDSR